VNQQSSAKRWDTVTIIGVGLIGGSIGMALRKRSLARNVVGVGRTEERLRIAHERGAVTSATTDLAYGVRDAELIVVCTPVSHVVDYVRKASKSCPPQTLITDAGSTKNEICKALSSGLDGNCAFVGGHPLAGSEKSGPEFAQDDLFEGRLTVITPATESDERHVLAIEQFWRELGSHVVRATPDGHDRAMAAVSHLPHVVASVLSAATGEEHLRFAATGWRDTTRVAAGDVELWSQILMDNRTHILKSLDKFAKLLAESRESLAVGNQTELLRLLDAGKRNRDSVGS
jgi:prephenate dehydrogenase